MPARLHRRPFTVGSTSTPISTHILHRSSKIMHHTVRQAPTSMPNAHASTSASPPGLTLLMRPIPLVRQPLRVMKVVEEEVRRVEGAYISAGTCKGSGHHRSVSSFAGEFVWDPHYDNDPSPTTMTRISISILIRASETRNRYQIIIDRQRPWLQISDTCRSRFEIDIRRSWIWVSNNNDARFG